MKIERLLGIVLYLLNRKSISARVLAEHFEVSKRTIVRDIDTLTLAGIPIYATQGAQGGYQLMDTYKMDEQIIDAKNSGYIVAALKGLNSVFDDAKLKETLEKAKIVFASDEHASALEFDFSVVKESKETMGYLKVINEAINNKTTLLFEYTNSVGVTSTKKVEPIVAFYRWYGWYILAYCEANKEYRIYKIIRMRNLLVTKDAFCIQHKPSAELMRDYDESLREHDIKQEESKNNLVLKCQQNVRVLVEEYISTNVVKEDDEYFVVSTSIEDYDFVKISILLGFAEKVEVLEPKKIRELMKDKAEKILRNYS